MDNELYKHTCNIYLVVNFILKPITHQSSCVIKSMPKIEISIK